MQTLPLQAIKSQPLIVRIFHWGFAISLTGVLLTGLELHQPLNFLALKYGNVFFAHLLAAWLSLGFFALRLSDMLIRRDTSLLPRLADLKTLPGLFSYYLFLRPSPPPQSKYNIGQKLIFISWLLLFSFVCLISFASYWEGKHLDWVIRALGSLQILRTIKFAALIYYGATIPLHIYLSFTENLSRLQAMLTGYERN